MLPSPIDTIHTTALLLSLPHHFAEESLHPLVPPPPLQDRPEPPTHRVRPPGVSTDDSYLPALADEPLGFPPPSTAPTEEPPVP